MAAVLSDEKIELQSVDQLVEFDLLTYLSFMRTTKQDGGPARYKIMTRVSLNLDAPVTVPWLESSRKGHTIRTDLLLSNKNSKSDLVFYQKLSEPWLTIFRRKCKESASKIDVSVLLDYD